MKRCPNGTRKNPITNKCEKINAHKSIKKTKKVKYVLLKNLCITHKQTAA